MRLSFMIVFAASVLLASTYPVDYYSQWKNSLFEKRITHEPEPASNSGTRGRAHSRPIAPAHPAASPQAGSREHSQSTISDMVESQALSPSGMSDAQLVGSREHSRSRSGSSPERSHSDVVEPPVHPPREFTDAKGTVIQHVQQNGPHSTSQVRFHDGQVLTFHYTGEPWVVLAAMPSGRQEHNAPRPLPFTYTEYGVTNIGVHVTYRAPNNKPMMTLYCCEGYTYCKIYYARQEQAFNSDFTAEEAFENGIYVHRLWTPDEQGTYTRLPDGRWYERLENLTTSQHHGSDHGH